MKKIFTLLFLFTLSVGSVFGQAMGDYGSIATGNWATGTTWGKWNGTAFVTDGTTPTGSEKIFINPTHTVTVSAAVPLTGTLTMNGGSITATAAITFSSTSTLVRASASGIVSGTFFVSSGSTLTVNINVTCTMSSAEFPSAKVGNVNIASGVTATIPTGRSTNNISVPSGSTLAIGGVGDFFVEGNITGSGTIGGTVTLRFVTSNRNMSNVTFNNLTLTTNTNANANTGYYILNAGNVTVGGNLVLTTGALQLGANNLTVNGAITGGSPSSFIITNSTGTLIRNVLGGTMTPTLFPVGIGNGSSSAAFTTLTSTLSTANSYDPVVINPATTASFAVKVKLSGTPAFNATPNAMSRIWDLTATGAGLTQLAFTPSATVTPSLATTSNTPGTAVYGHYTGGAWQERPAVYTSGTWAVNHPAAAGFSPFAVGVLTAFNAVLLPIELSSFTANKKENKTFLEWRTQTESNNDVFAIERAGADAKDFRAIGTEKGAGTSSAAHNYTFTDDKPLSGLNYYRLKQTDYDGRFSYSKVLSVKHGANGTVSISPKATQNLLNVDTNLEDYTLRIFNTAGQEVKSMSNMSLNQSIDISELNVGFYFIKVQQGGTDIETIKVNKF